VGYEEGFVFGGGSAIIAPDGRELLVADPLEPEELTALLDAAELRRARIANPAHGIERHEMLIEALERAARPDPVRARTPGQREEARP
jgi:predicted amidohydrolase